jgi:predicted TIM-barrel fold metal-dependent hydrolase
MIDDCLVIDATAHGYNWGAPNWARPVAESTSAAGFGQHRQLTAEESLWLTEEEFMRDWPVEDVSDTLFFEAGVDMICHHGTPIWDFYKDGHSNTEKGFVLREQYPNRTLTYGAIDPFSGDRWKEDIEYLAERGVNGLKVYAARYEDGRTIDQRLDDPELGYPFIERALELGINVIATHKGIPFGPVRAAPYGVGDMPEALALFPKMNFEVVHSGWAFVEDTTFLGFFQNCWFNLETSFALIGRHPGRFADFMAALLAAGAADRIVYASGMALVHPLRPLQDFMDLQLSQELIDYHGCPQLTPEIKRGILGENFLRLHGIDPAQVRKDIEGDEIARKQAEGLDEPWSHMRSRNRATA